MGSLGDLFRETRETKGITLADVEQSTHVRERILEALETGDYAALPHPAYLRGLARTYANFLGLDTSEVNALLNQELGSGAEVEVRPAVEEIGSSGVITGGLMALVLGVVCVALLGWYLASQWDRLSASLPSSSFAASQVEASPTRVKTRNTPVPTPTLITVAAVLPTATSTPAVTATPLRPTSVPLPTSTVSPTATPEYGVVIEAKFLKRSWVQVLVDGEEVTSETIPAGEKRTWRGHDSVWMHAGQPDGVEIIYNGKPLGVLSSSGGTIKVEWTRP